MREEIDDALSFDPELEGFAFLDPANFSDGIDLDSFGVKEFEKTVAFYGRQQTEKKEGYIPSVSKPKLSSEENAMKEFKTAKKLIKHFKDNFETEKEIDLENLSARIEKLEKSLPHATYLKKREYERQVKKLRKELENLRNDEYSFQKMLKD